MPWAALDGSGNVTGLFGCEQEFPTQYLPDNDARVVAFLAPKPVTVLTFNQLLSRFTAGEQSALATAAQSHPQVLLWMALGAAANRVDLKAADTKAGMDQLMALSVITGERETEILTP